MKQTITRTITFTEIEYVSIEIVDGEPVITKEDPIKVNGNLNVKQALKEVENSLPFKDDNVTYKVTKLHYHTNTYEMNLNDFIKNSNTVIKGDK